MNLYDNSIVAYVIGHRNNNQLVFKTLDLALKSNPGASPMINSDRGFQYTSYGLRKIRISRNDSKHVEGR